MTKYDEAILHYKYGISHDIFKEPVTTYAKLSVEALEKQIPKKPIHEHKVYPKHDWRLDSIGEIDTWAWESNYHNGPVCQRCHRAPCELCNPDYDKEVCVVDEQHCPSCNEEIRWSYTENKFCDKCGQALDWSE